MSISSNELFIYIDKQERWACIKRDDYLDFGYGDPCCIGRGSTPEEAYSDLVERLDRYDVTNLEGVDPRFRAEHEAKLREQAEKDLLEKYPQLKQFLNDKRRSKKENNT